MTPLSGLLLAVAGFAGGAVNSAAGGGTLLVFPALLATGLPAVTANITASVGMLVGTLGGSIAYRGELGGQRRRIRWFGVASVIGGVSGALLLLATPGDGFRAIVPYLLLTAVALLLLGPRLSAGLRARGRAPTREDDVTWHGFVLLSLVTIYGSYFGAGLGVVLLAILGIVLDEDFQRINALKSVLLTVANGAGVAVFIARGHVSWGYAAVVGIAAFAGGTVGARAARRLPTAWLRATVAILGTTVAIVLLIRR